MKENEGWIGGDMRNETGMTGIMSRIYLAHHMYHLTLKFYYHLPLSHHLTRNE